MTYTARPAARTFLRIEFAKRSPLAESTVAWLLVPTDLVEGLSPEEVAEEVFVATNAPFQVEGLAGAIRARFTRKAEEQGIYYPTLSVGDYVRAGKGPTVKVESIGFSRVASV
jgi:hypothetical protein